MEMLSDGQKISHYRIIQKLGEGGMGVVYKAHDSKLDRTVALKFLPAHLSGSEDDKARFVQEARAASSLNHPNICTIFDIDEFEGQMFIAMEFVDGQTLQDRKSSLSLKQALEVGIQIADGLAVAHEKGIVHRDIKPENIMIRKDGIVQIMDFGLAKIRSSSSKINRLTKEGSTLGTAGYMSPEQVQGHDADHRSDIFSFGVLLYEFFTGQLPFRGVHETAQLYEIVNVDAVPMSALKPDIDPELDRIVLECLEKEPSERYQSAAEISKDLKRFKRESSRERMSRITGARPVQSRIASPRQDVPSDSPRTGFARNRVPWLIAGVSILTLAAVLAFDLLYRPADNRSVVRFTISMPANGTFGKQSPAVSPDGEKVAFVASDSTGRYRIWIRYLSSLAIQPLAGTEDPLFPFWSPDSRTIGFFSTGKLKKIDINGGPVQSICDAANGRGASWSAAGTIVFAPGYASGIFRVSASGGAVSQITYLDSSLKEDSHRWPCCLPDGKHFIYLRRGSTEKSGVYLGSFDSPGATLILPSKANAIYAPPGFLLFIREFTLLAQSFDASTGQVRGDPFPVADNVGVDVSYSLGHFSCSGSGTLALESGTGISDRQLTWYDRAGKRLQSVTQPGQIFDFALSPDEKRVAFRRVDQTGNHDLWILDLLRSTESRLTFKASLEDDPVWSPDGDSVIFDSNIDGVSKIHNRIASGAGNEELVLDATRHNYPCDWSADGRFIIYNQDASGGGNSDLWVLPLYGHRHPFPFASSDANEENAKFSPDGKWIVYESDESGRSEVYVQSFPATGGKWQVSVSGGGAPQWSKNGKEIYYAALNKMLMAVEVTTSPGSFVQGVPKALFTIDVDRANAPNRYAVSRDGKRILANVPALATNVLPIAVTLNWTGLLPQK